MRDENGTLRRQCCEMRLYIKNMDIVVGVAENDVSVGVVRDDSVVVSYVVLVVHKLKWEFCCMCWKNRSVVKMLVL